MLETKNIVEKVIGGLEVYVDEHNNMWECELYSYDKVVELVDTMIECQNCLNCKNCTNCKNCDFCVKCTNCTNCISCIKCTNCIGCIYCYNCNDCSNCEECYDCSNCMYCSNCEECTDCEGCNDCHDCEHCKDCNDCIKDISISQLNKREDKLAILLGKIADYVKANGPLTVEDLAKQFKMSRSDMQSHLAQLCSNIGGVKQIRAGKDFKYIDANNIDNK